MHWKGIVRNVAGWGISDHLGCHPHYQFVVCVERIFAFQRPTQYRSIGLDDSHGTLIDLRLPIKHASADFSDLSLDTTPLSSLQLKTNKVAIGKPNFEVVATGSNDIFCSFSLLAGEGPKAGCDWALIQLRVRQGRRAEKSDR